MQCNPDRIPTMNKKQRTFQTFKSNSSPIYPGLSIVPRPSRLPRYERKSSTQRAVKSQVAARNPKKKSSSRLLCKKRGTVGPRERRITKVDFPLRRRNKFVAHSHRHPSSRYSPPGEPPRRRSPFYPAFSSTLYLEDLEWDDYRRENLEGEPRH